MALPTSIPSMSGNSLAADARSLDTLKLAAGSNDPKAAREAAKQFNRSSCAS
jgi:peptidoglycan hydrolase FlgJ